MRLTRARIALEAYESEGPGVEFIFGDARRALALLAEESRTVDVFCMDPPFLTGKDWGTYQDELSRPEWLALMREALQGCLGLLAEDGSLYLHVDHRLSAHARLLLDEVFGEERFLNEIIWAYRSGGRATRHFRRKHDTIFLYGKGERPFFQPQYVQQARQNHMRRAVDDQGRAYRSIRSAGKEYRYYEDQGAPVDDVWTDISHLQQRDPERTGYATQKPVKLLRRMVAASCREGGVVMDPFCGSGTAMAAALEEGHSAIGADASGHSLRVVRRRFAGQGLHIRFLQEAAEPKGFRPVTRDGKIIAVEGAEDWRLGRIRGGGFYVDGRPEGAPGLMIQTEDCCAHYAMDNKQ